MDEYSDHWLIFDAAGDVIAEQPGWLTLNGGCLELRDSSGGDLVMAFSPTGWATAERKAGA